MKSRLRILTTALAVSVLCACGSSGSGSNAPLPVNAAIVNTGNAQAVAGSSVNAALQSGAFGGVLGDTGLTAVSSGGASKSQLGQFAISSGAGTGFSEIPVGPETTPCAVSGSLTLSGDIANSATITAGDFINLDWDSCDDGLGQVIDGLLGMTFTSFVGDALSGEFLLGIGLTVSNFQVTEGADINSANGDVSLSIDTRSPPLTVATTSGSTFSVNSNGRTETLSNFSSTVTNDAGMLPSHITTVAMGTVTSSEFTGSVSYTTPVPFESIGDAYPYTGELLVTGASNATLRLIALDEINVRIEADYDGDGAVDETIDTTWDALINQ